MSIKVAVQLGFTKNLKEGQIITWTLNGKEVDRERVPGMYLTDMSKRYSSCWYLADLECSTGDILVVDVKTGIRQKGQDESRTFRNTYKVDESLGVSTVSILNVGKYGYPLVKGRVVEVAAVSKAEERQKQAESLLDDERF